MDIEYPKVDLEGRGNRSKVKVIRSKSDFFRLEKNHIWKGVAPRAMKLCQMIYKVEVIGQMSRSSSQKRDFRSH